MIKWHFLHGSSFLVVHLCIVTDMLGIKVNKALKTPVFPIWADICTYRAQQEGADPGVGPT